MESLKAQWKILSKDFFNWLQINGHLQVNVLQQYNTCAWTIVYWIVFMPYGQLWLGPSRGEEEVEKCWLGPAPGGTNKLLGSSNSKGQV